MKSDKIFNSDNTNRIKIFFEKDPLLIDTIINLLNHCQQSNWAGYDPYDALNSEIFTSIPFFQNRFFKLLFTQVLKRSPINLRPILNVPKAQNPKALALFCSSLLVLYKIGILKSDKPIIQLLRDLIFLKSPNVPYHCWGYHFDWQARDGFVPKFTPNIICTTFAGNAFLDAYDRYNENSYLKIAINTGDFIINGLNYTKSNGDICISYTPLDWSQVHNANLLGAAFLSRLYSLTKDNKYLKIAESAAQYSILRQRIDGSWAYGEHTKQQWIDNFHTGYNLVALKRFSEYTNNVYVQDSLKRGFGFYREHFFTNTGIPKYYHNNLYPIDIHSIAYSIVTLVEFKNYDSGNLELARRIFNWSVKEMQSPVGDFYYQKKRLYKNKISYIRWSQAWMLYALSVLCKSFSYNDDANED